jgi:hypothetical protein
VIDFDAAGVYGGIIKDGNKPGKTKPHLIIIKKMNQLILMTPYLTYP